MKFYSRVETLQTQCMTHYTVLAQQGVPQQTSVRRRKGCYSNQTKMVSTPWETQEIVFSLVEWFCISEGKQSYSAKHYTKYLPSPYYTVVVMPLFML